MIEKKEIDKITDLVILKIKSVAESFYTDEKIDNEQNFHKAIAQKTGFSKDVIQKHCPPYKYAYICQEESCKNRCNNLYKSNGKFVCKICYNKTVNERKKGKKPEIKQIKEFVSSVLQGKKYKGFPEEFNVETAFYRAIAEKFSISEYTARKYCLDIVRSAKAIYPSVYSTIIKNTGGQYPQQTQDRAVELIKLNFTFVKIREKLRKEFPLVFTEKKPNSPSDMWIGGCISEGIGEDNIVDISSLDTQILQKIIPIFARTDLEFNFISEEIARIEQLAKEVL